MALHRTRTPFPFLHHPIQHSRNRHSQQHIDHIMRLCVHGCDDDAHARQQKYAEVHRLKAPRLREREQGDGGMHAGYAVAHDGREVGVEEGLLKWRWQDEHNVKIQANNY